MLKRFTNSSWSLKHKTKKNKALNSIQDRVNGTNNALTVSKDWANISLFNTSYFALKTGHSTLETRRPNVNRGRVKHFAVGSKNVLHSIVTQDDNHMDFIRLSLVYTCVYICIYIHALTERFHSLRVMVTDWQQTWCRMWHRVPTCRSLHSDQLW